MQAAPARYVSVSELYSTDEVELLLDEIRELEPTSCRGEDLQDFEIAGSGCGLAGGASPGTERSWDSHAGYRRGARAAPRALAPLYCGLRHLAGAAGAARLLLAACAAGACACAWAGAGRGARVPLAARLRALLLAALLSLLVHGALLVLHVTRLARLLPLPWRALGAGAAAASGAALLPPAALTLHALLAAPEYRHAPPHVARPLCAAAGLGLAGSAAALFLATYETWRWRAARRRAQYRAVPLAPHSAADAPHSATDAPHSSTDAPHCAIDAPHSATDPPL